MEWVGLRAAVRHVLEQRTGPSLAVRSKRLDRHQAAVGLHGGLPRLAAI